MRVAGGSNGGGARVPPPPPPCTSSTSTPMSNSSRLPLPRPPRSPSLTSSKKPPIASRSKSGGSTGDSSGSTGTSSRKHKSNSTSKGPSHKPDLGSQSLLQDPSPTHLAVVTDDLSNLFVPDLGVNVEGGLVPSRSAGSGGVMVQQQDGELDSAFVWNDENYDHMNAHSGSNQDNNNGNGNFFWRNKGSRKVSCADVASVGNASDTPCDLYTVSSNSSTAAVSHRNNNNNHNSNHNSSNNNNHSSSNNHSNSSSSNNHNTVRVSGRDLHEAAKCSLNAADYHKALPQFQAILAAQVERFGTLHPSVGAAMHNVGVCRQRMKEYEEAEDLFCQAIQIRRQTLGPDHLEVAASLSKLGQTRVFQHKLEEAFEDLRLAVKIARQVLGYQHKTVAQMLCHTACLYFEAGEFFAAQASFQDALDIYRMIWKDQVDRDGCMVRLIRLFVCIILYIYIGYLLFCGVVGNDCF
jgi:tetratricopeptide (TPR) repeat protein